MLYAIYIGDDEADEDAFQLIRSLGGLPAPNPAAASPWSVRPLCLYPCLGTPPRCYSPPGGMAIKVIEPCQLQQARTAASHRLNDPDEVLSFIRALQR